MEKLSMTKEVFALVSGAVGGCVAACFGGWSEGLLTLIIVMAIDYATGLITAGVFKASTKTETGALESKAGWKGLIRKGMTLLIVMIAYRLDLQFGTSYIRDAVIIGFVANEIISIVENAGLMGLPMPKALIKAVDVLSQKADEAGK